VTSKPRDVSASESRSGRPPFRGSLIDENMFAIDVCEWGLHDLLSEYRIGRAKKIDWQPGELTCNENVAQLSQQ
jgi:hypothetical protein